MSYPTTISNICEQATQLLQQKEGIAAAYLLGSAVCDGLRPDSDIDIALLMENDKTITPLARLELAAELEVRFGRIFDLGLITTDNIIYASEAILKGKRLFATDEDFVATMETRLLGNYILLKQDRKVVEDAYNAA